MFFPYNLTTQAEVPDRKSICPNRLRRKVPLSRLSQTESVYVQIVPDRKCICPDYYAFKTFGGFFVRSKCNMSRPPQTKSVYVQTFVRSYPDHHAFIRVCRPCNFERTTPPSCVNFGLDISTFGLGPHDGH